MKFGYKMSVAASALFLLAACETPPSDTGTAGGTGDYATSPEGYQTGTLPGTNIPDRVFFAYDSSVLSSESQGTLERQASWLRNNGTQSIIVEGHADERGTREYNLALGERRASAAKSYLVSLGIPSGRITTVSYGKERPAVLGSNESAWAQNRRAVTVLQP